MTFILYNEILYKQENHILKFEIIDYLQVYFWDSVFLRYKKMLSENLDQAIFIDEKRIVIFGVNNS